PFRADTLRNGKRWITVAARKIKHALSSCDAGHGEQLPGDRGGWLAYVVAARLPARSGSAPFFALLMTNLLSQYSLNCHDVCLPFASLLVLEKEENHFQECSLQDVQNTRSEEHTSELQSPDHLVCRLLLEKKT